MKNTLTWIILLLVAGSAYFFINQSFAEFKKSDEVALLGDDFQVTESLSGDEAFLGKIKEIKNIFKNIEREKEEARMYHIYAGGDVMLDRGVEGKVRNTKIGAGDWNFPWNNISEDLKKADYVHVNLEGSASNVGVNSGKKYSFRFDPESLEGVKNAGVDLVSLANNHALDWGRSSLCETAKSLEKLEIDYIGAGCAGDKAHTPHIETLGNTRVAFIAFTEFYIGAHAIETRGGYSEYDMEKIKKTIKGLREIKLDENGNEYSEADVVMMSMHWGIEYKTRSNAKQQKVAHELVDAGLDVLIGHHPHVAQEIERYGEGWIIYSLGNFIFDQYFSEETMKGLIADIQIQDGEVKDINPIHIKLNDDYQPSIVK